MTYKDIRVSRLEEELLTAIGERDEARREVTRLSNYETSYNNLRLIVNDQYNEIGTLEHERNEAWADATNRAAAAIEAFDNEDLPF